MIIIVRKPETGDNCDPALLGIYAGGFARPCGGQLLACAPGRLPCGTPQTRYRYGQKGQRNTSPAEDAPSRVRVRVGNSQSGKIELSSGCVAHCWNDDNKLVPRVPSLNRCAVTRLIASTSDTDGASWVLAEDERHGYPIVRV